MSSAASNGPYIATDLINSTHHPLTKLEFGSSGTATLVSSANPLPVVSTSAVALSTTGMGGSSAAPLYVLQGDTNTVVQARISGNSTAILSTASKVQVEPGAGSSWAVTFSTASTGSVVVSNSTAAPIPVLLQASTATVTIQGTSTAVLSTASKVQVEPISGSVWALSTNSTVGVQINGGQSSVTVAAAGVFPVAFASVDFDSSATSTQNALGVGIVVPSTAGPTLIGSTLGLPVTLAAGSTIAATISTASVIRVGNDTTQLVPVRIEASTITQAVSFSTASTASVIVSNSTAAPIPVLLQSSTATVTIQGNSTVALAAGSTIAATISTASAIRIDSTGTLTVALSTGTNALGSSQNPLYTVGGAGPSTVTVVNDTATLVNTAIHTIMGSTGHDLDLSASNSIQPTIGLLYGSAAGAIVVSTANPLPVLATVNTGDSSVTVKAGANSSAAPVWTKSSGGGSAVSFSTASTASVIISGGQSTALISTASIIQVEPKAGATWTLVDSSVTIKGGKSTVTVEAAGVFPTAFASVDFDSSATSTSNALAVGIVVPSTAGPILIGSTLGLPVTLAAGSTIAASISGNATVSLVAGSTMTVSLTAGSTIAASISGNATVTLAAGSTIAATISTASKIVAELSTTGMGGSSASPSWVLQDTRSVVSVVQPTSTNLNGVMRLWAGPVESTYSVNAITSTAAVTIYSSAASTRFNVTDLLAINAGTTEVVLSIYSASTAGSLLFQAPVSTAAGGFGHVFATPRFSTAAGVAIVAQILPASTVYLNTGAFRST